MRRKIDPAGFGDVQVPELPLAVVVLQLAVDLVKIGSGSQWGSLGSSAD
jgi:hypothetical protein